MIETLMTEDSPKVNILITGTPGTGKTTLSEMVASSLLLRHVNVGQLIKDKKLHDGYIPEFDSYELNEDKVCIQKEPIGDLQCEEIGVSMYSFIVIRIGKVCDELEPVLGEGGNVVDYHSCGFFPERWFQLVVVLKTDNAVLYPRLEGR